MQQAERFDIALYRFAAHVYDARLAAVPADVLSPWQPPPPPPPPPPGRAARSAASSAVDEGGVADSICATQPRTRIELAGVEAADVAVSPDDG
eukprot:1781018-Prymnesium_polylepis.1